jgi:cephalosporin-C deacetylase-like acetyl esterase
VGKSQALGGFGTFDMAGNVREWCWNRTGDQRYILGGAWDDLEWAFVMPDKISPFDRSETNGFRCVLYTAEPSPDLTGPLESLGPSDEGDVQKPVSDQVFEVYKRFYTYDSTKLDAVVESTDESMTYWRKETVTFNAAYGKERVIAHLYLPKNAEPPYQAVIYYPTAATFKMMTSDNPPEMTLISFLPRNGRALVLPVYKGMAERRLKEPNSGRRAFINYLIHQVNDYSRTVDYLSTRPDIDKNKLAYMGASTGGRVGPLYMAIEQRLKAGILIWGGLTLPESEELPPEVNPLNFAPRSRIPVLMINGLYDTVLPVERSQRALLNLFGAPEKDKKHAIIAGAHVTPMKQVITESLNWLDRYLGPVQLHDSQRVVAQKTMKTPE